MALTEQMAGLLTNLGGGGIRPDPMMGASIQDREIALQQKAIKDLRGNVQSLFGGAIETRTPGEQAQAALAELNPSVKADRAKILDIVSRTNPERVPMLREEFSRRDVEEDKASALSTKEGLRTTAIEKAVTAKYGETRPDLIELAKQGFTLKEIGDFAAEDKSKKYLVSGNNVLDTTTGEFLSPPPGAKGEGYNVREFFDEETKQNVVQWVSKDDPNEVFRTERQSVDEAKESATFMRMVDDSNKAANKAGMDAQRAIKVAQDFDKYAGQIATGVVANVSELYKGVTGTQDAITLLRLSANQLKLSRAIENLPQGPATDKDIALVLGGELADNADPATVAEYARALARLARKEQEYYDKQSVWYSVYGTPNGFNLQVQKDNIEETFANVPKKDLAFIEANMTEENLAYFNETFGFDYLGLRNKLNLVEKGLNDKYEGGL
jgi:hypothetical protein